MSVHSGALEAVERVLNRGGEPDEVVAQVAAILRERVGRDVRLGAGGFELDGGGEEADRALLDRVNLLASPYLA